MPLITNIAVFFDIVQHRGGESNLVEPAWLWES